LIRDIVSIALNLQRAFISILTGEAVSILLSN
jgi:hypothetical protein